MSNIFLRYYNFNINFREILIVFKLQIYIHNKMYNNQANMEQPLQQQGPGYQEKHFHAMDGCCMLVTALITLLGGIAVIAIGSAIDNGRQAAWAAPLGAVLIITSIIMMTGLMTIAPNCGVVIMFCGKYLGTIRDNGLFYVCPFYAKHHLSFRSMIFETDILKVNDLKGNPIQIGAVVIWKIDNSAKSMFDVADLNGFVRSQSETAVRKLASTYPYDHIEERDVSLKDGGEEINKQLVNELQYRLNKAGVVVEEAKLNRLNYSEEIAQVMLRRQQAEAIISARQKIINGAVGIVAMALDTLKKNNICELNKEESARLTSNLLIVLCSESQVNPIVNAGS